MILVKICRRGIPELVAASAIFCALQCHAAVLTGIDVLERDGFAAIAGKNVGLITNHSGQSRDGRSTIDILGSAPSVHLKALYSPEHGIRGDSDTRLSSGADSRTGLPVNSLYGASCRPEPETLTGIDILVFDIQDAGVRYYTYIGTLYQSLRAARNAGIPLVVLDRPNPLGGRAVEGAVPDDASVRKLLDDDESGCRSLTSVFPLPTRYGMTIGELAQMFNVHAGIGADLHVVRMEGWDRGMLYSETGLPWINPSPNLKTLDGAMLYSGPGMLESANLSTGRGTAIPFEIYGAPWLNARKISRAMNRLGLRGVYFSAETFVPSAPGHPYRGKKCRGIRIHISDRNLIDPQLIALNLLREISRVHGKMFHAGKGFAIQSGDAGLWKKVAVDMEKPSAVLLEWANRIERFKRVREKYLLYDERPAGTVCARCSGQ